MAQRLIEEKWALSPARAMERRLDTLRRRADFLARRIGDGSGERSRDEQEYAALMWAISELTGIGEEVRRERLEQCQVTAGMYRKAVKRAEQAETLNAQYRVTVAALRAEVHRLALGRPIAEPQSSDAVDPHAASTGKLTTRD